MMDTVLNIGLSDDSVRALAKQAGGELAGSERWAWDSYRRLIQMFGKGSPAARSSSPSARTT
jgi:pyruvate, orthophosphate dikinase